MKIDHSYKSLLGRSIVLAPLVLGIYLIVIKPFGARFEFIPGDLGDARLNSYILEHFYRWAHGWTGSYWNAPFFYPNQYTMAFSENLLGSAPLYALLRFLGLDRLSAFQGWFLAGYIFNYISAAWALSRLRFTALAVAVGAFFFAFGLPVLGQENHAQLLYRFAIPPAFYFLWTLYQNPRLDGLRGMFFWLVCQCLLGIYMGLFLIIAICVMGILLLIAGWRQKPLARLLDDSWKRFLADWSNSRGNRKISLVASTLILGIGFSALIWPYYHVSRLYSFVRSWQEISRMLPRPESYLLADNSQIWSWIGSSISTVLMRHEHQLFIGGSIVLLIGAGTIFRFSTEHKVLVWAGLWTVVLLMLLTLNVNDSSLYRFWILLPGAGSLRAVTRMELIWMWPLAVFAAWAVDGLWGHARQGIRWAGVFALAVSILLFCESIFYRHAAYTRLDYEARLDRLRQQIPEQLPDSPILFVARNDADFSWAWELDVMLVTQELGWATLNGYSGHTPSEYEPAKSCRKVPRRIQTYMQTVGSEDQALYLELIERVVTIGFDDCDPAWWEKMP